MVYFPGSYFPGRDANPAEQLGGFDRERRAQEQQPPIIGVALQPGPLFLGESGAAPVILSCFVLLAEPDTPGLCCCTFSARDVRLKLDRSRSCVGDRVDIGMRGAQASIVRLRNLTDHQAVTGL